MFGWFKDDGDKPIDDIERAARSIAIEIDHSGVPVRHLCLEAIIRILREGHGIGVLKVMNDGLPPDELPA
jgi:hypothetical protein